MVDKKTRSIIAKVYLNTTKTTRTLNSFLNDMYANSRLFYNSLLYTTIDLLPYLNQIIQPNIRPVREKHQRKFDLINIKLSVFFFD